MSNNQRSQKGNQDDFVKMTASNDNLIKVATVGVKSHIAAGASVAGAACAIAVGACVYFVGAVGTGILYAIKHATSNKDDK